MKQKLVFLLIIIVCVVGGRKTEEGEKRVKYKTAAAGKT